MIYKYNNIYCQIQLELRDNHHLSLLGNSTNLTANQELYIYIELQSSSCTHQTRGMKRFLKSHFEVLANLSLQDCIGNGVHNLLFAECIATHPARYAMESDNLSTTILGVT